MFALLGGGLATLHKPKTAYPYFVFTRLLRGGFGGSLGLLWAEGPGDGKGGHQEVSEEATGEA